MTAPVTNFKLGLFALAAMAGAVIAVLALGLHTGRTPTVEYHTLLDESVQGLDVGAQVDFRGVRIGSVARIEIARDRRHVDVALAIDARAGGGLALAAVPPVICAQLSTQGLTGVKYIDLDLLAAGEVIEAAAPAPRYLPARPSLSARLERQGMRLGVSLPALVDDARGVLHRLDTVLDDFHSERVPERLAAVADRTRAAVDDLRRLAPQIGAVLRGIDRLVGNGAGAVDDVRRAVARLDSDGLLRSARRASDAVGDLGQRAAESTGDVEQAMRDVADAARALRAFLDELERDPELLLKGRPPARRP